MVVHDLVDPGSSQRMPRPLKWLASRSPTLRTWAVMASRDVRSLRLRNPRSNGRWSSGAACAQPVTEDHAVNGAERIVRRSSHRSLSAWATRLIRLCRSHSICSAAGSPRLIASMIRSCIQVDLREVAVGEPRRGPPGELTGEVGLRVVDVEEVLATHRDDPETAAGAKLDEAFPREGHQRFAHRGGADPEPLREVLGAQRLVARRLTADDHRPDAAGDLRAQPFGAVDRLCDRVVGRAQRSAPTREE